MFVDHRPGENFGVYDDGDDGENGGDDDDDVDGDDGNDDDDESSAFISRLLQWEQ